MDGFRLTDEQWRLYVSWWRDATREIELLREYIAYLERVAPRAPVVDFPQKRSLASHTAGHERNPYFNKKP